MHLGDTNLRADGISETHGMHCLLQLRFSRRYEMGLRDHAVSDSDAILNRTADQRDLLRFLIQPRETLLMAFNQLLKGS